MKANDLKALIDKAIGKRGIIRTPAWWVRKIFYELVNWVTTELESNSKAVLSSVDEKMKVTLPYIIISTDNRAYVVIDGVGQYVPKDTSVQLYYNNTFKLRDGNLNTYSFVDLRGASRCPEDMSYAFSGDQHHWDKIAYNFNMLNTYGVKSMSHMFEKSHGIPDLSAMNTMSVEDVSYMFANGNMNPDLQCKFFPKAKDLSYMFKSTRGVKNVNSYWGNAVNMEYMFYGCSYSPSFFPNDSLTTGNQVTNIKYMFCNCTELLKLNLRGLNTVNVVGEGMVSMFSGCKSLTSLELKFNTAKVTSFESMFSGCASLPSLNLSSFDTTKVQNMAYMFQGCSKLEALTLSSAFFNSASLTTYDFSGLTAWTEANSLAALVKALPTITAAKTIKLSANTKAALTDEQKETITTTKGWTIA